MFVQAIVYVLEYVARFFILLLILRFLMQVVRIPFKQPLGQFTLKMSNWLVLPLRKFIPGWGGYDLASMMGALLVAILLYVISYLLMPFYLMAVITTSIADPVVWLALLLLGIVELISMTIYCLIGAMIVQAVLSWTNPYHPFAASVKRLCDPLLAPLRRFIPPVANVDLTPMVMMLILMTIVQFPVANIVGRLLILLTQGQ